MKNQSGTDWAEEYNRQHGEYPWEARAAMEELRRNPRGYDMFPEELEGEEQQ